MKESQISKFDFGILNPYNQIIIYVQKTNDLDTCAFAAAAAKLLDDKYSGSKKILIKGLHSKSRFLPELKSFSDTQINGEEKSIAILSEISDIAQIEKIDQGYLKKSNEVIIFDHHNKGHKTVKEFIGKKPIHFFHDPSYTSVCEVLWDAMKDCFDEIPARVGEILFMGLYADTKNFTSAQMSHLTFQHISEMIKRCQFNPSEVIGVLNQKPVANLQLFADTMKDALKKKNLIFVSLNPKNVHRRLPSVLIKGKDGRVKQRQMLTYIPRGIEQFASVNTIVFVHYHLQNPFDSMKKYVYIVLVKENPALAFLLKEEGFRQNRNRGSKAMNFSDIVSLIERNEKIFIA